MLGIPIYHNLAWHINLSQSCLVYQSHNLIWHTNLSQTCLAYQSITILLGIPSYHNLAWHTNLSQSCLAYQSISILLGISLYHNLAWHINLSQSCLAYQSITMLSGKLISASCFPFFHYYFPRLFFIYWSVSLGTSTLTYNRSIEENSVKHHNHHNVCTMTPDRPPGYRYIDYSLG